MRCRGSVTPSSHFLPKLLVINWSVGKSRRCDDVLPVNLGDSVRPWSKNSTIDLAAYNIHAQWNVGFV